MEPRSRGGRHREAVAESPLRCFRTLRDCNVQIIPGANDGSFRRWYAYGIGNGLE